MNIEDFILFSGGANGAEEAFGFNAERKGVEEVNFTFDGHKISRQRGLRMLNHEELKNGDVSLEYVSSLMHRRYTDGPALRKILQSIWHQINNGQQIFVIGEILEDNTVKGGTGWGAEFAKICNKRLYVFDQSKDVWFRWNKMEWEQLGDDEQPAITQIHFTGTGTRFLSDGGRKAIEDLFNRSFP